MIRSSYLDNVQCVVIISIEMPRILEEQVCTSIFMTYHRAVVTPQPQNSLSKWVSKRHGAKTKKGCGRKSPFTGFQFLARGLLIALMMEAASASESLVNFYHTTRCNIPEDSHLHCNEASGSIKSG
jgi:hypothetical protein